MKKNKKNKNGWMQPTPPSKPIIKVPTSLMDVLGAIDDKFSGYEFSVLTNIDENLVVSEEYYIPPQEVGYAYIKYDPDPESDNWNTVIHKHPEGIRSFSSIDEEYINGNFVASLLYIPNEIVSARYNIKIGNKRYSIPMDVVIIPPELEIIGLENIRKPDYRHLEKNYSQSIFNYGDSYYGYYNDPEDEKLINYSKVSGEILFSRGGIVYDESYNIRDNIPEEVVEVIKKRAGGEVLIGDSYSRSYYQYVLGLIEKKEPPF